MNVGEMKKLIEGVPDNVRFYTIGGDHEAQEVKFSDWFIAVAVEGGHLSLSEFFGEDYLSESETKARALVSDG